MSSASVGKKGLSKSGRTSDNLQQTFPWTVNGQATANLLEIRKFVNVFSSFPRPRWIPNIHPFNSAHRLSLIFPQDFHAHLSSSLRGNRDSVSSQRSHTVNPRRRIIPVLRSNTVGVIQGNCVSLDEAWKENSWSTGWFNWEFCRGMFSRSSGR